jgi:hypothetical protein
MSKILLIVGAALLLSFAFLANKSSSKNASIAEEQFKSFAVQYGKVYNSVEEAKYRQEVFAQNYEAIIAHNSNPESTYEMGVNQFSDLTKDEFVELYLMSNMEIEEAEEDTKEYEFLGDVDWRSKGAVNGIKTRAHAALAGPSPPCPPSKDSPRSREEA